jgi:hypothetical protein
VVIGHSTKSIAAYATRLSQVRNDNNTKVNIPWLIHIDHDLGIQTMTTYIWCSKHEKLFDKEKGCSSCDAQMFTTDDEPQWIENWYA